MATLKAKRLQGALQKARNVGRVEEAVTIDGCALVLQNLAPEDYDLITQETADLDGAEYLHAYQIAHVSRSVVEIEGVDLRDVQFVEDDVPTGAYLLSATVSNEVKANKARDVLAEVGIKLTVEPPEEGGEVKTVKLEKAEWMRQRVASWGREALLVAYRKYAELVVKAEVKAKEGVKFQMLDESAEEKFRRLLAEAKELESDLPDDMIRKILDDVGYSPLSTEAELDQIKENARVFAEQQAARVQAAEQAQEQEEEALLEALPLREGRALPPELQPDPEVAMRAAGSSRQAAAELMKSRQPMNQGGFTAPVPVVSKSDSVRAPSQIRDAATTVASDRATEIAALEAQLDPSLLGAVEEQRVAQLTKGVAELNRPQAAVDGKGVKTILNQPPTVGLNPKYRPIPRG